MAEVKGTSMCDPMVFSARCERRWRVVFAGCALIAFGSTHAAGLRVIVTGQGKPAVDAVVSLHSRAAAAAVRPVRGSIDQRASQFVPRVTVVPVDTPIRFPNTDNIRHQVYSFSAAKRFELPLYTGQPAEPIVFNNPGVVELGCSIHDWMLAYVVVVDTPHYGVTDAAGRSSINAPAGTYTLRVWHPQLPGGKPHEETVVLSSVPRDKAVVLSLVPTAKPAALGDDRLRSLQEKFRRLKDRR